MALTVGNPKSAMEVLMRFASSWGHCLGGFLLVGLCGPLGSLLVGISDVDGFHPVTPTSFTYICDALIGPRALRPLVGQHQRWSVLKVDANACWDSVSK
jgi:hypothetical protein